MLKWKNQERKGLRILVGKDLFFLWNIFDGNGFLEWDEGDRICVVKGKDEQLWDQPRKDL